MDTQAFHRDHCTKTITLHQDKYILSILSDYAMEDCWPTSMPMIPNTHLFSATDDEISGFTASSGNCRRAVGYWSIQFYELGQTFPWWLFKWLSFWIIRYLHTRRPWNVFSGIWRTPPSTSASGLEGRLWSWKFTLTLIIPATNTLENSDWLVCFHCWRLR